MEYSIEFYILPISLLFLFSLVAGKISSRLGLPALLLFLAVGMISGSDGLGIQFHDANTAHAVSTVALCVILFSGGLDTKLDEIKPIAAAGAVLATVGVFLMAAITGFLTWWILKNDAAVAAGISVFTALLVASIMSSTDSASVFSILRSRKLYLKNNLRPLLELESGSNDPMAYLLVITLVSLMKNGADVSFANAALLLLIQLVVGAAVGYLLGKGAVHFINRIGMTNAALYPILVFTIALLVFSVSYFIRGNGYLAVYVAGFIIGNSKFQHKRSSLEFFDGLAWLSQLLTLGLLVNPHELLPVAGPAVVISLLMIFIARPASVFLCLLPFKRFDFRDKVFISWVGLRGAVPIIFAIIPLAENVLHARLIFNIVFFCTLASLLIQGTSLSLVAKWLKRVDENASEANPPMASVFAEEIKSVSSEIQITAESLIAGKRLMDLPFPEMAHVVVVRRKDCYFVPTGASELIEGDVLLVISNDSALLKNREIGKMLPEQHG
ncbi:MAG TPA: potassium/proton antiporter [Turneriella sp.]|nr:potassium/proton antiporter [Turneriella sp.]